MAHAFMSESCDVHTVVYNSYQISIKYGPLFKGH